MTAAWTVTLLAVRPLTRQLEAANRQVINAPALPSGRLTRILSADRSLGSLFPGYIFVGVLVSLAMLSQADAHPVATLQAAAARGFLWGMPVAALLLGYFAASDTFFDYVVAMEESRQQKKRLYGILAFFLVIISVAIVSFTQYRIDLFNLLTMAIMAALTGKDVEDKSETALFPIIGPGATERSLTIAYRAFIARLVIWFVGMTVLSVIAFLLSAKGVG